MKILYKEDSLNEFNTRWQEYIENNLSSYKYLLAYLEYMLLYSKYLLCDKSFVVIENNICVGICFLPIESYDNNKYISLSKGYTLAPLAKEKRIERKIFEVIDSICAELNIAKIKFYLDPLIVEYANKFNFLLEYNYVDTSSSDCLLNLKEDQKVFWRNLRKSYKALINSILKNSQYQILVFDQNNFNYDIHELYRELHKQCSGRATRSKETFEKQYELLKNGFASIFCLKYNNKYIGMIYFFHFQKTVVYASGADDPDFEDQNIPIYHVLLWKATLYYKQKEFEFMQYSQPCGYSIINGFDDYLDEKQINISHFKRGMGTTMIPLFRGIKYYNKQFFLEDIECFKSYVMNNFKEF